MPFRNGQGASPDDWISPSSRTTCRRASSHIVRKSMMSAPVVSVLVPEAHQARGDRVAIGLVSDQDGA
jgi:hypothetical protein